MTRFDPEAWDDYMAANAAAKAEYIRRPAARPHVAGHFLCLCCDILTAHPSTVCVSCQKRSTEWRDLANDPVAIAVMRRKNRAGGVYLRRVS